MTLLAFALRVWDLSLNRLGNQFYSAAARSGSLSWHNWFFASFDPGGFISVDKPPVALWIQGLSVRTFGMSSWSLLLPSVLAGTATVAILWCAVHRRFGVAAATAAAAALAVSPINVATDRINLPDPFMVLFLVGAAWAVLRSFDDDRWVRWLVGAGVLVGLAFNTKMLAAAIPVPAIGLAVLLGTPRSWLERVKRGAVFAVATVLASLPWMVAVTLTPASSRPYVGGSTNNSIWDLVFGYNGLARVDGTGPGFHGRHLSGGGGRFGRGGIIAGAPGLYRLLGDALAPQVSWLIPLALVGCVAALWLHRHDRERRAAVVLWGAWALTSAYVLSTAKGTFHSYYTTALAPAIAALVGIGGVALVRLARRSRAWTGVAASTVILTALWQISISNRLTSFFGWTRGIVVLLAAVAIAGFVVAAAGRWTRRTLLVTAVLSLLALLVTPLAWASSESVNAVLNASLPQAGPRAGIAGRTFGSATPARSTLADFLRTENGHEKWDLVVASSQSGSNLIAAHDLSVMALGGFLGTDPATSLAQTAQRVEDGQVRFFLVSGFAGPGGRNGFGGPGGAFGPNPARQLPMPFLPKGVPPGGRPFTPRFGPPAKTTRGGPPAAVRRGTARGIMTAVEEACTPLTSATTRGRLPVADDGQVYDCAGQGQALALLASRAQGAG